MDAKPSPRCRDNKKNEKQYMNPYSEIATMDGRYYDKKN